MKNKFFLLSTIISSCFLTINCYADTGYSNVPPPQRPCYPASACTGSPTSGGGYSGYGYSGNTGGGSMMGPQGTKALMNTSTQQFAGTIKSVNRVQLPNQTQIQITLSTDRGDLLVIVGPASFIDQQKVKLQAGDKVTVTGFPVTANGNQVVLASQIKKNGTVIQLLSEDRQPVWNPQVPASQPSSDSSSWSAPFSGSDWNPSNWDSSSWSSPFSGSSSSYPSYSGAPYSGSTYSGSPYSGSTYSGAPYSGSTSPGTPSSGSTYTGSQHPYMPNSRY